MPTGNRIAQKVGCLVHINPQLGSLGDQVRPAPHSIDSKNLLEHHLPRLQEHFGMDEKAMEAPTDPDEPTLSVGGLAGHVILPLM
jgi:hypothetical protein